MSTTLWVALVSSFPRMAPQSAEILVQSPPLPTTFPQLMLVTQPPLPIKSVNPARAFPMHSADLPRSSKTPPASTTRLTINTTFSATFSAQYKKARTARPSQPVPPHPLLGVRDHSLTIPFPN